MSKSTTDRDEAPLLCVGEVLWDLLPEGRWPGGAPLNVAYHLAALGEPVVLVSRIGDDPEGRELQRRLQTMGVDTTALQQDLSRPTGVVRVELNAEGNPRYHILEPAAWDFLSLTTGLQELAMRSRALIFGTLAQRHSVSRRTIFQLVRLNPYPVLDVNLRPPYVVRPVVETSLTAAALVKLNESELEELAHWFHLRGSVAEKACALAERFACQAVCVTLGARGAGLWYQNHWFTHPAFPTTVKDAVGAGDAFLAGFLTLFLKGEPVQNALRLGCALAAFVVARQGATPPLDRTALDPLTGKTPEP